MRLLIVKWLFVYFFQDSSQSDRSIHLFCKPERRRESKMSKLNASTVVGLVILICVLAAMVSIAIMQVIRTVEDLGPKIYIIGGAVLLVGALIPLMLVIMIKRLKKMD